MGYPVKQSQTAQPLLFLMVDSSDHVSAKTGLSPTVTISKNGGAFASPSGAVTEIGSGWYKVAGNATDTNTLGPLLLHATGSGADPTDDRYDVVAYDPQAATNLGLSALPTANPGASNGVFIAGSNAATSITTALTANITGNLSGSVGSVATGGITSGSFSAGAIDATAIANNAIDAATFAADVDAEVAAYIWNALTASYGVANSYGALLESGNVGGGAIVAASVTGNVGGSVASIASGGITSGSFATGAITAGVIAADAIGASELAADAATEVATAVWASVTRQLTSAQTFNLTGDITGNLSGSVGSVGTGGISSGSFAAGAITATAIAADAIGASELAADAITEIWAGSTAPTAAAIADAVWDETSVGHTGGGKAGDQLWTDLDAILDDTGTAGVVLNAAGLATDAVNEIADGVMTRASSNWEASAPVKSLGTAVMKAVHRTKDNAGSLQVFRSDGVTVHTTQAITTDAGNAPIDELGGAV